MTSPPPHEHVPRYCTQFKSIVRNETRSTKELMMTIYNTIRIFYIDHPWIYIYISNSTVSTRTNTF